MNHSQRFLCPVRLALVLALATVSAVRAEEQVLPPRAADSAAGSAITTRPASATPTASRPARRGYTAPGAAFRSISFVAPAAGTAGPVRSSRTGHEASEASLAAGSRNGLTGLTGAAGLSAPQPFTANAVVGAPGLQRGPAIGLGLVPRNNLFTRTFNPISGSNGACSILVNAGFFPDVAACRARLGR